MRHLSGRFMNKNSGMLEIAKAHFCQARKSFAIKVTNEGKKLNTLREKAQPSDSATQMLHWSTVKCVLSFVTNVASLVYFWTEELGWLLIPRSVCIVLMRRTRRRKVNLDARQLGPVPMIPACSKLLPSICGFLVAGTSLISSPRRGIILVKDQYWKVEACPWY